MSSPVNSNDFTPPNPSAGVCSEFRSLFGVIASLKSFVNWMVGVTGDPTSEFKASLASISVPTGGVVWMAASSVPEGFLAANGQEVKRTDYPALFATIGTTWGVPSSATMFKVPDLRGQFLLGASGTHAISDTGGEENHTLTTGEMPSHSHTFLMGPFATPGGGQNPPLDSNSDRTPSTIASTQNTGGGAAHNNMPPFTVGLWIIKF